MSEIHHLHLVEKSYRTYRDFLDDRGIARGPWVVRAPTLSAEGAALPVLRTEPVPVSAMRRVSTGAKGAA